MRARGIRFFSAARAHSSVRLSGDSSRICSIGLAELSHEAGFGRAAGGTIGYMPIEQMRLESPDKRTDEWALAALTYQMLTGDTPFYADTLDAMAAKLGMDAAVLKATVDAFNESGDSGNDEIGRTH